MNSNFVERASIVTKYGIPVMPLKPRSKDAFLSDWPNLATVDPSQIAKWGEQNPAFNGGSVCRAGAFFVFEIDSPNLPEQIEKKTGHSLEGLDTLVVQSSPGKFHFYFRHNERSEKIGNVSADDKNGAEIFSVRAHNQYVVCPGSIHPRTGKPYEVVTEPILGEIPTAPDWLLDWIEANPKSDADAAKSTLQVPEIIPEGGRDKWLFAQACRLRDLRYSQDTVLTLVRDLNRKCCKPPMSDSVVEQKVESAFKREPRAEVKESPQVEIIAQDSEADVPDMSRSVLAGRLGELCERNMLKDFPVAYAWPSLVTAASVLVPERSSSPGDEHLHNLYTALVGPVNDGKSQAIEWGMKTVGVYGDPSRYSEVKPGSAERLLKYMNGLNSEGKLSPRVLMFVDEWKFFFEKAAIENSVFMTLLTTGFYRRNATILDSHGRPLTVPAAFSWIGGIVDDAYEDCFSRAASLGLHDRFLHGVHPSGYAGFQYRPFDGTVLPDDFELKPVEIDKTVWECLKVWRGTNPQATREGEIALRVAYICACFDGAPVLYGKDLESHWVLATEQMKLRGTLKPNVGDTPDAQCAIKVENYLRDHGPAGQWLNFRAMMKAIHYERFGPNSFERTVRGLASLNIVALNEQPAGEGNAPGGRPAKVIRLVPE